VKPAAKKLHSMLQCWVLISQYKNA
jgi:hypothetical protein